MWRLRTQEVNRVGYVDCTCHTNGPNVYGGGLAENVTGAFLLHFSGLETKLKTTLKVSFLILHLRNGKCIFLLAPIS